MKNYKKEFDKILKFVKDGTPFAFSRFSDGEVTVLRNKTLILRDNYFIQEDVYGKSPMRAPKPYLLEESKEFIPEKHGFYRDKLVESLLYEQENYIKGIPGVNEWSSEGWKACIELRGGDKDDLSFSNVLINGNYQRFVEEMLPEFNSKKIVIVCNSNAKLDKLPFHDNIVKSFFVGPNCMINDFGLVEEMSSWAKVNNIKDHLFLFSAASLSNLLIKELYSVCPQNQYIDIGSALGPFLQLEGWKANRIYLLSYWHNMNHPISTQEDQWGTID